MAPVAGLPAEGESLQGLESWEAIAFDRKQCLNPYADQLSDRHGLAPEAMELRRNARTLPQLPDQPRCAAAGTARAKRLRGRGRPRRIATFLDADRIGSRTSGVEDWRPRYVWGRGTGGGTEQA